MCPFRGETVNDRCLNSLFYFFLPRAHFTLFSLLLSRISLAEILRGSGCFSFSFPSNNLPNNNNNDDCYSCRIQKCTDSSLTQCKQGEISPSSLSPHDTIPSSFDPASQICVVVGALLIIFSLSLDAGCCRKKSRTDDRCISPARRRRPPLQKRMNGNLFRDDQKFSLPSRLKQRFFPGLLLQQHKRQEGRWPKNAVSFGSL